ncbi:MAG: phospholipid carrier-dependent glycosyltransferase, partial [Candidatus Saccharimonadales bacterium]
MEAIKKHWPVILLIALALITRLAFLWYPAQVVFDEVYFGSFVNSYFTHHPYFDIHPPLGKLMIFGFLKLFGASANFDYSKIGSALPAGGAFMLRFLPAIFGAMLVILIYFFIRKIGLSKKAAFLGAALVLLDNAILTQSKFTLLDVFLIFFGFLSLYLLLWFHERRHFWLLGLAILSATFSASIKWTGLAFMAVIVFFLLNDLIKRPAIKKAMAYLALLAIIPPIVYGLIFAAHFSLLNECPSGFVPLAQKIIQTNYDMYHADATLTATHPYSSKWYQWPFMHRPIWYWTQSQGSATANIWFIGNPIIWFSVLFSVIFSLAILFSRQLRNKLPSFFPWLLFGFFASFLPLALVSRVLFLYHYLPALVFGIIIIAVLYDTFLRGPS